MSTIFDFEEIDFSGEVNGATTPDAGTVAPQRRYDPTLFKRAQAANKLAESAMAPAFRQLVLNHPQLFAGLEPALKVHSKASSTPGQGKVLVALMKLVLSRQGASLTQTACRSTVQAQFPTFAVTKDWTVPLPSWALGKARSIIDTSMAPFSKIAIKKGHALRDLHQASKNAASEGLGGESFRALIHMDGDTVTINGTVIKLSNNSSGGHTYQTLRISRAALLSALRG